MELQGKTRKKTYEEVTKYLSDNGYKLLDSKYVNSRHKMCSVCPNGHEYLVSYYLFKNRNFRCPICSNNKKKTLEEVREIFANRGYELKSTEYSRNIRPLNVVCPKNHLWKVSLNNFMKGVECPVCSRIVVKYSIEEVRSILLKEGYVLVSAEYVNASTKIDSICPKGHEYSLRLGDFNTGYRCAMCIPMHTSKIESELLSWIKTMYPNTTKKRIKDDENKCFELDIFIKERSLAIEVNGIYWHSDKFKNKNYHLNKMKLANKKGYRLITIFEDEWRDRKEQVKNFLISILRRANTVIHARKTTIKEITVEEASLFLNNNHIQGSAKSDKAFGLFYGDKLVAVITGNKHHRQYNDSVYVLNRLAFLSDHNIVGGASRLTKSLITYAKNNGYDKIISWSDNRWSEGNVYEKLGFSLEAEMPPDYSYVHNRKRLSKQSCQKKNLIKKGAKGNTESEMANSLGYIKIWDCGKKRWAIKL